MPKLSGIEVLDFIKKDEELKKIPVVMLTTSSSESDIQNVMKSLLIALLPNHLILENF
jgi:CheY-like chemotaxis protein